MPPVALTQTWDCADHVATEFEEALKRSERPSIRSELASLWRVPDKETHQLMREFYRRVWSKGPISKAEALRQAQLWMLENWKPRGTLERSAPQGPPPPYYWAAFVLSGDWR